jgi:putative transposase
MRVHAVARANLRRRDNVFVERLWRSVKYEEVYLRAYDTVSEARSSIGRRHDTR